LEPDTADILRNEVVDILRKAKPTQSNITKKEKDAITRLKQDISIQVLPADKGRATVIIYKADYETKVKSLLDDEKTYVKLDKDSTQQYKRKLVSILSRLRDEKKLSEQLYKELYPTVEKIPRMYCTPKVHKAGYPLRPTVDYTGSICYNTSRFLADILNKVVGKTEHHVKNSKDLVTTLTNLTVDDDEVIISYDVVSLFTNTPIDKAVEVIKQKMEADQAWKQVTLLESEDVVELLEFTLSTTYFHFRGELYKQSFGTAMGSPVSPLVADNFMEHLEQTAIATESKLIPISICISTPIILSNTS